MQRIVVCITATGTCQVQQYRLVGEVQLYRSEIFAQKRNILDFDLLFNEFPEHILPYDYETYFASPERFVMVTTNCITGEANYFEEKKTGAG